MTNDREFSSRECETLRESIHARVDGTWDASDRDRVEAHLQDCEPCRNLERELTEMRHAMRDLPEFRFPDDALQEVWDQTVDAEPRGFHTWLPAFNWRFATAAAAAAVLLLAVGGWLGFQFGNGGPEPAPELQISDLSPEQLQQLHDALKAFELTSDALKRSQQATVDRVLEGQVGKTLDRLPVDLPEGSEDEVEKGRLGV